MPTTSWHTGKHFLKHLENFVFFLKKLWNVQFVFRQCSKQYRTNTEFHGKSSKYLKFAREETKDLGEYWRKGEGKEHVKERKAQSIAYWNERGNVVPAGKRNKGPREDL